MGLPQLYALTSPLITTSSGAKMGKTASGAIWLDADRLSPYEYWQFWRNTEDADVGRFLKLFTELPLDEIARLAALEGAELNDAKKVLATEATALLHGRPAGEAASEAARRTFEEGGIGDALPSFDVPRSEFAAGLSLATLFVRAGLAASNGEVRRAVANSAISVNDTRVSDPGLTITAADLNADGVVKLSLGRKKHVLVKAR
jgi:tyrosyl-tRNA synthetase